MEAKYLEKHRRFTLSTTDASDIFRRIKDNGEQNNNNKKGQTEEDEEHQLCRCVCLKLQRMCDSMCSVQTMTQSLSLP